MNKKKASSVIKKHNDKLKEWLDGNDNKMIYIDEPRRMMLEQFLEDLE